jgi:hypothetical protein
MTTANTPEETMVDSDMNSKPPRWYNAVLGAWLFVSAFLWHHAPVQFHNTWVMGIVIVVLSLLSTAVPWTRYLSALAGLWLFFSTLYLPRSNPGTTWHNCLIGLAVLGSALNARRTGGPFRRGARL